MFMPRRYVYRYYFCWYAELLPHTEQVVFFKTGPFGATIKEFVDIKHLQKVAPEMVVNSLMWKVNHFDPDMVFMDGRTREIYVFDKRGLWNKDAIEHKLLY